MDRIQKSLLGIVVGFIAFMSFVFAVNYSTGYYDSESVSDSECMDLMGMDFNSEQECIDFVRELLVNVDNITDDPETMEKIMNIVNSQP